MCYALYLSTDSREDLSLRSSDLVRFSLLEARSDQPSQDPCITLLEYPRRWYVGSKAGCSCTFRHLYSTELGFGEPVDWYPEEADEIEATKELYNILRTILESGCRCDLVNRWEGTEPDAITTLNVLVQDISPEAFRLFENHKFRLKTS